MIRESGKGGIGCNDQRGVDVDVIDEGNVSGTELGTESGGSEGGKGSSWATPMEKELAVGIAVPLFTIGSTAIYRYVLGVLNPRGLEALIVATVYLGVVASAIVVAGMALRNPPTAMVGGSQSPVRKNAIFIAVALLFAFQLAVMDSVHWKAYGSSQDEVNRVIRLIGLVFQDVERFLVSVF